MSPKVRETLITSVALLAVFAFLFTQTMSLPSKAALFPRMCLILLSGLTLLMLYLDVQKFGKDHDAECGTHVKDIMMPLLAFVGIIIYAILFDFFGYFPATIIMLVAFMLVLKVKPWWLILAITAGYSVFIYLMFVVWLKVNI